MDEIGGHSVGKVPVFLFPDIIGKKVSATHTGAGSPGPSPGPAQSGPGWHTAEAGPGLGPDQAGSYESNIFSEICLPWFETETSFRIEIWTRQYRQIAQNFDPRLMEIILKAPDIIENSKNNKMFQTDF